MPLTRGGPGRGEYRASLPVLGVSTAFVTNEPRVLSIIADEYGHWAVLGERPDVVQASTASVRIVVRHSGKAMPDGMVVEYRVPDCTRLEIECAVASGTADSARFHSMATVEGCWLEHPRRLAREVIEPLTLFLLGALDRTPVHAAAVARGDVGIVLAGPSGVGKSTLLMAATRAGFAPIADDPVYVQADPRTRVWGRRRQIHLLPDAVTFFPEIRDLQPSPMPNGKSKLVVDAGGDRRFVDRVGLCVLRRGVRPEPLLTPITPTRARQELTTRLEPGFDLFRGVIEDRVELIAAQGAWILELGHHPRAAVPLLSLVADSLEEAT